ncbi:unconventional myosin-xviiib [Limosa lapponica baueri]|uniref:Unconventional myosin-xviiib n=1 Tax=Limosa lapponica baueri TaxID=1758121 RepID=A0A2I0T845_LIMLA|nr:unconventional myosin-xviiib [Limosa lapponica baueri]
MGSGLYEELFAAVVSLINRSFSSQHLSMASIAVVDTPGFHNPRHQRGERAATFEELCHNYVHERLQALFYEKTFVSEMERYREENVEVSFDLPERSPLATLSIIDLGSSQGLRSRGFPSTTVTPPPRLVAGPDRDAVKELVWPRWRAPLPCRAVAGLEGRSQAVLHRNACIRKTFASSFAAVKKRSVCAQLKLQADALMNLLRRSQLHFVHCLLPGTGMEGPVPRPPTPPDAALRLDVPTLRAQLEGTQLLDALRLHRIGYADRLLLTQFRRRFQILAPDVMKKHTSAYEVPDESKGFQIIHSSR